MRANLMHLSFFKRMLDYGSPNRALMLVLVPIFLILSSSVYPATTASIENKDLTIISKVMAEKQKDNIVTGRYQAHMQITASSAITPSSPTPLTPTTTSEKANVIQSQNGEDNKMQIASIDSGKAIHTVWHDNTSGNFEILYKRDGADYDPTATNLSNNGGISIQPKIAVSGNNVHVVWNDFTPGNSDVFYRRSFDGGATFSPTINLSNNAGTSETPPAIAVSANNVHVVWADNTNGNNDIFYRRSTDGGASFTEPIKNLSSNAGESFSSAIAVSGSNVHVAWSDDTPGNTDIFYRRSLDGGSTFPNIIKNLSSNAGDSFDSSIATSGSNVHVAWQDSTPGNFDILYRRSLDNGTTFPNIIRNLSDNTELSGVPSVAASGDNVHVVWAEVPAIFAPGDIKYRRSLDNGTTFPDTIKNLSANNGFSESPAIGLSSNNIYVVWRDNTTFPGASEIIYRTSSDNGATFPSLLTNVSVNGGVSSGPSIAVS